MTGKCQGIDKHASAVSGRLIVGFFFRITCFGTNGIKGIIRGCGRVGEKADYERVETTRMASGTVFRSIENPTPDTASKNAEIWPETVRE